MPKTKMKTEWEAHGISRATYFRRKKEGKPFHREKFHKQYVEEWVIWRESGLIIRPWSSGHKGLQLYYLGKYFEKFHTVATNHLEEWLGSVPTQSYSPCWPNMIL